MAPAKSATSTPSPFSKELFTFLGELTLNNERDWFKANQARYESAVREPAFAFIRAMAPRLGKISPHFLALDKKAGGSLMRVHRDLRFSKNKDPYKTNVGIQFRHEVAKDVHAPGFYLHIEPEKVFVGIGMWRPDADALKAVRDAIVENPAAWKRMRNNKKFSAEFELGGDSLKRPPRGYDKEHVHIEDLMRKDHIASCELKPSAVTRKGFVDLIAQRFAAAKGYVKFQTDALGLAF